MTHNYTHPSQKELLQIFNITPAWANLQKRKWIKTQITQLEHDNDDWYSMLNDNKSKDDWLPNTPVYIEVNGTKSNKGGWGHMGMYQRELNASKLVVIRDADGCDGK